MNTQVIQTNREITLNGQRYPLHIHVSRRGASVPLPENYPDTPLARYVLEEHDGLLSRCSVSMGSWDSHKVEVEFPLNRSYFLWKRDEDPRIKHLSTFYNYGSSFPDALPEERKALKGIGKEMLCNLIFFLADSGDFINPEESYITAEADGALPDPNRIKELNRNSEDHNLLFFVKTYPHAAAKYILSKAKYGEEEPVSDVIAQSEANGKLIEYYKRTFGFTLLQSGYSTAALIGARVTDILKNCSG